MVLSHSAAEFPQFPCDFVDYKYVAKCCVFSSVLCSSASHVPVALSVERSDHAPGALMHTDSAAQALVIAMPDQCQGEVVPQILNMAEPLLPEASHGSLKDIKYLPLITQSTSSTAVYSTVSKRNHVLMVLVYHL